MRQPASVLADALRPVGGALAVLGLILSMSPAPVAGQPLATGDGNADAIIARGRALFSLERTPEDGLGPLFNGRSCAGCHNVPTIGGNGGASLGVVLRVGRLVDDQFDPLIGRGGPVARAHSVQELGYDCDLPTGIPPEAEITSVRVAPPLYGSGLIDSIPDEVILAGAFQPPTSDVHGHPNIVDAAAEGHRVGRFGWKADAASLEQFVAEAFRTEEGVTNPLAPETRLPAGYACARQSGTLADDGSGVDAVRAFVASLPPPSSATPSDPSGSSGAQLFVAAGCATCHTPQLQSPGGPVPLYSDLLLHDMGPDLEDGVVQSHAQGHDWRTTPLWGLAQRTRYLHDGRARTLQAAMQAHGGEATAAAANFRALAPSDREALLAFLSAM